MLAPRPGPTPYHFNVRLEEDRLCCLVIVGVRPDGTKELVAIADGYRESTESWAEVLRELATGDRAPVLAVGDGALGFWAALRDVFPETKEQRCWVHATANILDALPKSPPRRSPKKHSRDPRRRGPRRAEAVKGFADEFGPSAEGDGEDHRQAEELLAFFDFPAEHWIHLRTTNPIESTFSTVRLRTKVTGARDPASAGLAMAYKLSTPPSPGGVGSTATSSYHWCALGPPSSTASYKRGANRRPTPTTTPGPLPPDAISHPQLLTISQRPQGGPQRL